MPRKKSEFKPLTEKRILEVNPKRAGLIGSKQIFKNILKTALKTSPFDKKRG